LQVLLDCRMHERFVQELLDERLEATALEARDRGFATELVYGVQRRRLTLDTLLRPFITRPLHQVEPWIWEALRIGAYQLCLLTHIPVHAALNETVELAAEAGMPRGKGILNAVLRKLAELVASDTRTEPGPDALPLAAGTYRRLTRPLLPDPAADPLGYVSAGFSLPPWLVQRWRQRFDFAELRRLGFWFAGPAPLWLRANPLRCTRDALLTKLQEAGIAAAAGESPQAVLLHEHYPIRDVPGFADGWFTVQDAASQRVGRALSPKPGARVLDLCAAPGGKTTHLAELMGNEGKIIACDLDEKRLRLASQTCRRLGVTIVEPTRIPEGADPPGGLFDAILVDAPCSNTGVLGRRPEARWRLKPSDIGHLVQLQTKLLIQAAERVRPEGAIVYSTCSIEPEENQQVVANVREAFPDLDLEEESVQTPGAPADGGYWARLRRRGL
jgi:16S rRNA (cytosine967-C5)-methyltransferase